MSITLIEAIKELNPTAEVSYQNEDIDTIHWDNGTPVISNEDILAKQSELQTEYDALAYARARDISYPNLKEFAEAYTEKEIGGDDTKWDAYVINYNKVRTENPK